MPASLIAAVHFGHAAALNRISDCGTAAGQERRQESSRIREDDLRNSKMLAAAALAAALACAGAAQAQAQSQDWPTRPVTMVVPFAAGGPVDVLGRILAQYLGEAIGKQVIVDNVPGGGGISGSLRVSQGPPDGHMLRSAPRCPRIDGTGLAKRRARKSTKQRSKPGRWIPRRFEPLTPALQSSGVVSAGVTGCR